MINKLLGVVAVAAVAFALAPAEAAHMGVGCNGAGFAKAESAVEASADGPNKMAAQKEVAAAQDAYLNNKFGACGSHLGRTMRDSVAK
jgi:hypothetical protein